TAAAQARADTLAQEARALQLLDRELAAASGTVRRRFVEPVLARLMPYLDLVLPGAEPTFSDGFALEGLARSGNAGETVDRLSAGTREQLSVLVRLGFARLLAETGAPTPL